VANQIAAGEVVQRPASAVKELLENAVDSGASAIKLIIKDAGKTLVQVIDNGCGMSERDARMCFERHATSKIQTANDLLTIHTLGFRGEALASIASIAQVELKTKRTEDEIGTCILVEGSEFKGQTPVSCTNGVSISVKNLFFNVPARRNFLKSNTLELKYIIEEFFRVALIYQNIGFTFYNQDKILFQVPPSNLKQRIVALFGAPFNQRLVPVSLESAIVNISGFIGKPEFARKSRGEQYFFANGRYIKNPYLHHAIENAFQELIPKDSFPSYFLHLTVDPGTIDVNIHPTKTEINFQDARSIYAIIHSAVRQSIGKFNVTPSLDFEPEPSLDIPQPPKDYQVRPPTITINPDYNPFEKQVRPQTEIPLSPRDRSNQENWKQLYDPLKDLQFPGRQEPGVPSQHSMQGIEQEVQKSSPPRATQVQNRFILTSTRSGFVIIDQQNAHERILYERLLETTEGTRVTSQRLLMPQTLNLSPGDTQVVNEYHKVFAEIGFEITGFGKNSFLVNAVPAECASRNITELFEKTLEMLREHPEDAKSKDRTGLTRSLAKTLAIRRGTKLQQEEMDSIVESLFACKIPDVTVDGRPTMFRLSYEELMKVFK
jgi:DNA mismatch repair protein MutL